ncbi:hypothetical protein ACIO13_01500 [Streptomyces sp. NPDC087425]|uniref:hypothetical protein n=1 Tax=unclassified Streptomyces TaxID=2593676 RepID=UPI00381494FB
MPSPDAARPSEGVRGNGERQAPVGDLEAEFQSALRWAEQLSLAEPQPVRRGSEARLQQDVAEAVRRSLQDTQNQPPSGVRATSGPLGADAPPFMAHEPERQQAEPVSRLAPVRPDFPSAPPGRNAAPFADHTPGWQSAEPVSPVSPVTPMSGYAMPVGPVSPVSPVDREAAPFAFPASRWQREAPAVTVTPAPPAPPTPPTPLTPLAPPTPPARPATPPTPPAPPVTPVGPATVRASSGSAAVGATSGPMGMDAPFTPPTPAWQGERPVIPFAPADRLSSLRPTSPSGTPRSTGGAPSEAAAADWRAPAPQRPLTRSKGVRSDRPTRLAGWRNAQAQAAPMDVDPYAIQVAQTRGTSAREAQPQPGAPGGSRTNPLGNAASRHAPPTPQPSGAQGDQESRWMQVGARLARSGDRSAEFPSQTRNQTPNQPQKRAR